MFVYVVYEEYQKDTPLLHYGFPSEDVANAYAEVLRRRFYGLGQVVYGYEPGPGEIRSNDQSDSAWPDWDVDVRVELMEIRSSMPTQD